MRQQTSELFREKDVGQFAAVVRSRARIALHHVDIVQINVGKEVGQGRHVDNSLVTISLFDTI